VTYDELPKVMLLTVIEDKDKDFVIETILKAARTGSAGNFGDGKSLSRRWKKAIPSAPVKRCYREINYERSYGDSSVQYDECHQAGAGGRRVLFINHTESNRAGKGNVDFFLLQGAETGHEEAVAQLGSAPKLIPKRLITLVVQNDQVKMR